MYRHENYNYTYLENDTKDLRPWFELLETALRDPYLCDYVVEKFHDLYFEGKAKCRKIIDRLKRNEFDKALTEDYKYELILFPKECLLRNFYQIMSAPITLDEREQNSFLLAMFPYKKIYQTQQTQDEKLIEAALMAILNLCAYQQLVSIEIPSLLNEISENSLAPLYQLCSNNLDILKDCESLKHILETIQTCKIYASMVPMGILRRANVLFKRKYSKSYVEAYQQWIYAVLEACIEFYEVVKQENVILKSVYEDRYNKINNIVMQANIYRTTPKFPDKTEHDVLLDLDYQWMKYLKIDDGRSSRQFVSAACPFYFPFEACLRYR